jgi:hypothetical protein
MHRLWIIILSLALCVTGNALATPEIELPEEPAAAAAAPAMSPVRVSARDDVRGLSWWEITTFSPAFTTVDDGFVKRLEKTWKLKLRFFRRNAAFPAKFNPDPNLRAQWKKVVEECTRIINAS